MTHEARVIYKFLSLVVSWSEPECQDFIIRKAFEGESPEKINSLIKQLHSPVCNGDWLYLISTTGVETLQKLTDYALS